MGSFRGAGGNNTALNGIQHVFNGGINLLFLTKKHLKK